MSILPAKKYPNPTEINGKIHANLNRRWLSLSHLVLHVHSPFSALSSRRRFTPTSLAIARSPLAARLQTARHGQWGPGGEHRPWEKTKSQVQPPANQSTQRLLQCRYNQETIFFHFHRTINLIYIDKRNLGGFWQQTNSVLDTSKCMYNTHASSWRMLYVCTHLYLVPM